MPDEHNGLEFSFSLTFSGEPDDDFSYGTLKNHAFDVDNGSISKAQRQESGKNRKWTIYVVPTGTAAVTVTLPPTTGACTSSSAICTEDGRKLSNRNSRAVAGPVGISVADASVEEGDGAILSFVVSLSRAALSTVTIDYATSDGTATADDDYTPAYGTLHIGTGESSGAIEVSVEDDLHNEGNETLTVTLSNPSAGRLADATATGTIENHDPMPQAFLSRFGRAIAVDVVDRIERRMEAPRRRGFEARFGGLRFRSNSAGAAPAGRTEPGAAAGRAQRGSLRVGASGGAAAQGASPTNALAGPGSLGATTTPAGLGPQTGMHGPMGMPDSMGMQPQMGMSPQFGPGARMSAPTGRHENQSEIARLLEGSSISMGGEAAGGTFAFWSDTSRSSFSSREDVLSLGGDVRTTMFGADYQRGRMITGVSVARSAGEGRYSGPAGGHLQAGLTGVYPWIGYQASERITVWGVAGRGGGSLLLAPEGANRLQSSLSMTMGAVGTRGELTSIGGFALAVKTDALWVTTGTAGTEGPAGNLQATSGAVRRLRSALEGAREYQLAGRLALSPSVELGLRHDAGDAENGAGVDVGGGIAVSDNVSGLGIDLRMRVLVVHQQSGYAERNVALGITYDPRPSSPLGLSARVSPGWGGNAQGGAAALWSQETMAYGPLAGTASAPRLDGEVGYGLAVGRRLVGTPMLGLSSSEHGRQYRTGYGLGLLEPGPVGLTAAVEAHRREGGWVGEPDHGVAVRATVGW